MRYLEDALARAKRRKSPWNLLLIPAVFVPWALLWYASAHVFGELVRRVHPKVTFVLLPETAGGVLTAISLLFAWLPVAMIIGNHLLATIPQARRALHNEARGFPGTDLVSSNRVLLKIARFVTPAGLLVALVGALIA